MIRAHTAALAACLFALPCLAFELKRDSTGAAVSWKSAVEFVLDEGIAEALGEDGAEAAAQAAMASVRAAAAVPVSMRTGPTKGVGYDFAANANNRSEIVAVSDWEWDERAIAVTIVTVDARTHAIVDADIAFNTGHRKFAVLPASSDSKAPSVHDDVQNTLTHELGHAVGLSHNPNEPLAVMYPAAKRGEVTKRTLSADDVAGLAELYGDASSNGATGGGMAAADEQTAGCSAVPGMSGWLPLLGVVFALLRRRMLATLAASTMAATAAASDNREAPVAEASCAAKAEVLSRRTLAPAGRGLLTTEVRLKTTQCLKGECKDEWVLYLPGGRYGDFEQTVEGLAVPEVGEQVAFTVAPGEQTMRPAPARVRVFRLKHGPDLVAFLTGLHRASGSGSPQR